MNSSILKNLTAISLAIQMIENQNTSSKDRVYYLGVIARRTDELSHLFDTFFGTMKPDLALDAAF